MSPAIGATKPTKSRDRLPKQVLSRADMVAELRLLMGGRSYRTCGKDWDVDWRELHAVIHEWQYPGERLLAVMGLREESDVMYVRVEKVGGRR